MAHPNPRARAEPIQQSTIVRSDRAHTFGMFVGRIGAWWPRRTFAIDADRAAGVRFEEALDGRVGEVWEDGTEHDWGRVVAWDPPSRFAITWRVPPADGTEVEVRFAALGPNLTRVELEHRGWDRLSAEQRAEAGDLGEDWHLTLGRFAAAAEAAARAF
ncbi:MULTISPECIES: SRPBCC domain-containing protein [Actinomadura]|uniref:Activator of Hsp90 ATPase homologue 1/2-like C-terminal domain-containing protein n=1 Tax=Actinomadura miaoliensis TaxID=430685 RepID=A0ABP7VJT0_9ACTN